MEILLISSIILIGLLIRIVGAFAWGCQDIEFWKSFGVFSYEHGAVNIYGENDEQIRARYKNGEKLKEVLVNFQNRISYSDSYNYQRPFFFYPHPPLFLYCIMASFKLFAIHFPDLRNRRWLNFYTNLTPLVASALTALFLYYFVGNVISWRAGIITASIFWLNPVVLLNCPLQAFVDSITGLFLLLAFGFCYLNNFILAFFFYSLTILHKPTGIITVPIFLVWMFMNLGLMQIFMGVLISLITALVVCWPYLRSKRILTLVHGILSITSEIIPRCISIQSFNFWFPLQYILLAKKVIKNGLSKKDAYWGGVGSEWPGTVTIKEGSEITGLNLKLIGSLMFFIFTIVNLLNYYLKMEDNQSIIFLSALMQIYAFFMLRVSVHTNHYFTLIPLFAVAAALDPKLIWFYASVSMIFSIQDFIFFGIGRDWCQMPFVMSNHRLGWLSLVFTFLNCGLFIYLSYYLIA